jgi:hypothetical protein
MASDIMHLGHATIFDFVKEQRTQYRALTIEIAKGCEYSQYQTPCTIKLYNSKFTTGTLDSLKCEKPFYNYARRSRARYPARPGAGQSQDCRQGLDISAAPPRTLGAAPKLGGTLSFLACSLFARLPRQIKTNGRATPASLLSALGAPSFLGVILSGCGRRTSASAAT